MFAIPSSKGGPGKKKDHREGSTGRGRGRMTAARIREEWPRFFDDVKGYLGLIPQVKASMEEEGGPRVGKTSMKKQKLLRKVEHSAYRLYAPQKTERWENCRCKGSKRVFIAVRLASYLIQKKKKKKKQELGRKGKDSEKGRSRTPPSS